MDDDNKGVALFLGYLDLFILFIMAVRFGSTDPEPINWVFLIVGYILISLSLYLGYKLIRRIF